MVACKKGDMDIMTLLLAVPGVNVNVADVSCVSGKRLHAVISHCYVRCESKVWQDGWVRGMVILEAEYVGGGLWLVLLCAGGWADCADGGL
jgi:hypothetical protein